jgi:thiol-disulfide isomerase/thioredoxin
VRIADLAAIQRAFAEHRGKPLLVNVWATWCVPCCQEMPDFAAATQSFRARGGVVLGVAMECVPKGVSPEQGVAKVQQRAPQLGIDFPVLVCSEGDLLAVRQALSLDLGELPVTFAFDRAGQLVDSHDGKATRDEFVELAAAAERQ